MATSCLKEAVRLHLAAAIQADTSNTSEDILRCYKEQATLLFETERVKSALTTDPFESLHDVSSSIARLKSLLRVTEYNCVNTVDGYSRIEAAVLFVADKDMKPIVRQHVKLKFLYERTASESAKVMYAIDLSKDFGIAERLLWVNVEAIGNSPSSNPAKNLADEASDKDDDQWSDMDDDDDQCVDDNPSRANNKGVTGQEDKPAVSRAKETANPDDTREGEEEDDDDAFCDRFIAGMDPDLLTNFVQWTKIGPIDDITAFFLLMTFQFYELEWDVVGYLLESVFGSDDDDDDDEASTGGTDS